MEQGPITSVTAAPPGRTWRRPSRYTKTRAGAEPVTQAELGAAVQALAAGSVTETAQLPLHLDREPPSPETTES